MDTVRERTSGLSEQDESGADVFTVKAVDRSLGVFFGGHECQAVASDFSVLPLDDDILGFDVEVTILVELDNLVDSDLPWQASHLDSARTVSVVELVSQAHVLVLWPIIGDEVRTDKLSK